MSIGQNIKRIRQEKGLTQKRLGELCGINEANIRKYELGGANPKLETIQKIAEALKVPLGDLISPEILGITNDMFELFAGSNSLEFDVKTSAINALVSELNEKGKDKAIEQIELLTKIPEYRKE